MCTKGVVNAPFIVKSLLFLFLPLNVICSLFAFVAPLWLYKEQTVGNSNTTTMSGLWMKCEKSVNNLSGEKIGTSCTKYSDKEVEDYSNVSRIFMTVGTFCVCVSLIGVIWFVIRLKGLRIIAFCNIVSAVAAITTTIAVTIQGMDYRINQKRLALGDKTVDVKLHAAFYVGSISAFLSLFSVFLISLLIVNFYSGKYEEESVDESYRAAPKYGNNYRGLPPGKQMRPQSFEYGRFQASQMPGVRY